MGCAVACMWRSCCAIQGEAAIPAGTTHLALPRGGERQWQGGILERAQRSDKRLWQAPS